MDTYLIVLGLISLSIIIIWNPNFTEKMTNADLKKVTDFHKQKTGHWDINRDKNKKPILNEQQIQGPKIEPVDPKSTSNSTLSPNANKTNSVYPDIFGPDSKNAPGHLDSIHNTSSTHFSEMPQPNNEYLGFEEVSNSGDAMPFLSDFSKFMK
jgi:hypothetical protein